MRRLQPVLWTKGVFLSPQHLQAQDRFLESNLQFQVESLTFFPWGFENLQIDRAALANGEFALASASGILPDGLLFEMPGSDPAPPPRPLETCWEPDQESLDVYLTVPQYRDQGLNVSMADKGLNTRYLAEVLALRDENPLGISRLVDGQATRDPLAPRA